MARLRASRRSLAATMLCLLLAVVTVTVAGAAGSPPWNGRWQRLPQEAGWSGPRIFVLTQKGSRVTGRHSWKVAGEVAPTYRPCETRAGGTVKGSVSKRTLNGTITWPNASGVFYVTLSPNGREFVGQVRVDRGACKNVFFPFNAKRR